MKSKKKYNKHLDLIKKASIVGTPLLKKHSLREAFGIIYSSALLGNSFAFVIYNDYKKAKVLRKKLRDIGFVAKIDTYWNHIKVEWI